jgi:hypothetical protein
VHLREARPDDAPRLLVTKALLRVQVPATTTATTATATATAAAAHRGGFLLGSTLEQYRTFIDRDLVWVLACCTDRRAGCERGGNCPGIAGFAIVLPWSTLRRHPAWLSHSAVRLTDPQALDPQALDPQALERLENGSGVAYYEQLAVLPHGRDQAASLALRALDGALAQHDTVLATTVRRPWHNRAALPLLRAAGFVCIGEIEETYDEVGPVLSSVHLLERARFEAACRRRPAALVARLRSTV